MGFNVGDRVRLKHDNKENPSLTVRCEVGGQRFLCSSDCGQRMVWATTHELELFERNADLKQVIREVLLSDEFLKAFAAAWQKTPILHESDLNLIVADETRPYKSWNEIIKEAFQPITTAEVTSEASLEPAEQPKASLNSDTIPEGYRKLNDSSTEPRQLGDLRWSVAEKRYIEISGDEIGYANRDNWAACRKVEPAIKQSLNTEPPDGWRWLEVGETLRRGDTTNTIDEIPEDWIGIKCAVKHNLLRRNKFEVGEKVVHEKGNQPCEVVFCDHEKNMYLIAYKGSQYAYQSQNLAPYIEDAK